MAKKKALWFKFYPSDFEMDERVREMTDCELGLYLRCLNHSWVNNGLPDDLDRIARIMRMARKDLDHRWKIIGPCFVPTADGRLVNPRQEQDRIEVNEYWESRSKGGKKGMSNRWGSSPVICEQSESDNSVIAELSENGGSDIAEQYRTYNTTDYRLYTDTIPPIVPPSKSEPENSGAGLGGMELVEWLRSIYAGEFPEDTWRAVMRSVNTPERLAAFRTNAPLWMTTRKYREGFAPNAVKFLASGVWLNPPPAAMTQEPKPNGREDVWELALRRARERDARRAQEAREKEKSA